MELNWHNHIHSDTEVLLGKPVIKGTRISVELILELCASGWTNEMILKSYPHITEIDLRAVFAYLQDSITVSKYHV